MAQRISRAKQRIRDADVPFALPPEPERDARLRVVLHVLYLMFNEGYTATSGPDLVRVELSSEAIRLARAVHRQLPDDGEVAGLLALDVAHRRAPSRADRPPTARSSRSPNRTARSWDADRIAEGVALVTDALATAPIGPYQIQAAIAAVHDEAPSADATDWPQILALYELLERVAPNPMVTLNRAVAVAMVHGPRAGLDLLSIARCRRSHGRAPSPRVRACAPARDGGRPRRGPRRVPRAPPAARPASPSSATSNRERHGSRRASSSVPACPPTPRRLADGDGEPCSDGRPRSSGSPSSSCSASVGSRRGARSGPRTGRCSWRAHPTCPRSCGGTRATSTCSPA